jgi:hypothetical protein
MTIYRSLPDDMKRKYESSNIIMLPDNSDVSNDTFENMEEISADEQLDIKTLQERGKTFTNSKRKNQILIFRIKRHDSRNR